MFERMRFPICLIFIIFPFSKWRILCHHMKYPSPPIRDIGMYTSPFRRFDFASIFIVFSFSKMADLMALYEIPPPPIQRVHMLFCSNFLSFCRFQRWRTLQRLMNYPSPSNQRSRYVYLFFLPIDFASIFIVFLFSKMADLMALYEIPPPLPPSREFTCFFAAI